MQSRIIFGVLLLGAAMSLTSVANAHDPLARARAQSYTWHGFYYDPAWNAPVALVVPPTATVERNWGWGVGSTRVTRINHQFTRRYPNGAANSPAFMPTPNWPSDTTQFGYYSVRGPW